MGGPLDCNDILERSVGQRVVRTKCVCYIQTQKQGVNLELIIQ